MIFRQEKEEYYSNIRRSIDLFQRLYSFSLHIIDIDKSDSTSSMNLYLVLSQYGIACCYFLLSQYQLSQESYYKCISHILNYLSTFNTENQLQESKNQLETETYNSNNNSNVINSSLNIFLTSENTFLYQSLSYFNKYSIGYEIKTTSLNLPKNSKKKKFLLSCLDSFSSHINSSLNFTPTNNSSNVNNLQLLLYSILFDSYICSLYCSLSNEKYMEVIEISDSFICGIEKFSEFIQTISSNSSIITTPTTTSKSVLYQIENQIIIEKLTLGSLLIKCWSYNQSNCIDLEIQKEYYSQIYEHSKKLSESQEILINNYDRDNLQVNIKNHLVTLEFYKIFFICAEYFLKQSKLKLFDLNDNVLHSENYELSDVCQHVVNICTIGIIESGKYLTHVTETEFDNLLNLIESNQNEIPIQSFELISNIHYCYIDLLTLHLWRGLTVSSRSLGQRYFECGHTCCEEYTKLRKTKKFQDICSKFNNKSNNKSSNNKSNNNDIFDQQIIWKNEFNIIVGDISFHLAYTYMRSGKIKYSIEEIKQALKLYEEIQSNLNSYNSENDNNRANIHSQNNVKVRLRHSWGLYAVILCSTGNKELNDEIQTILNKIKSMDIGPLQGI